MPTTSFTARMVMAVIALHLIGFHSPPIYAENLATSGRESDPVAGAPEPVVLKTFAQPLSVATGAGNDTQCFGDCNQDGGISVNELILLVNIAQGGASSFLCGLTEPPLIPDLIRAVNNALSDDCAVAFTYRLSEGSSIACTFTPEGSPPEFESLSGTFRVVRSEPRPPNTIFTFTVVGVDFQGGTQFSITGGELMPSGCAQDIGFGCLQALTPLQDLVVFMGMSLFIDTQIDTRIIQVGGSGPLDSVSNLPTFRDILAWGGEPGKVISFDGISNGTEAGCVLSIFAVPEREE